MAKPFRQPLADDARNNIVSATRRKTNNNAHRPCRIRLRPRDPRHRRQRGSAYGQMQEFATAKFHVRHRLTPRFGRSAARAKNLRYLMEILPADDMLAARFQSPGFRHRPEGSSGKMLHRVRKAAKG